MGDDLATESILFRLRWASGQQRAVVRWLEILSPFLLVLFVVAAAELDPGLGWHGHSLVVSLGVGAFVLGVLGRNITTTRRNAIHLAFVVVMLVGSAVLIWEQPDGPGTEGALVGVVCAARLMPVGIAIRVLVAAFAVLEVLAGMTGGNFANLAFLTPLGAFVGMLFLASLLSEANQQAEDLLVEVQANHAAQAQAARMAERQRVAREMHDVLAHSLSGLILQIEGARMLADADPDDPRLPQILERAHQLGRTGLTEARHAIGLLRDEELPGPQRLTGLAEHFQTDHGIPCTFEVTGETHDLGTEACLAVYRVAQEALTNIAKHAQPERVELRLDYGESAVRLTVEDIGVSIDPDTTAPDSGGYGLTGMRERAELLGGTLSAQPTGHGFRVVLDVPV